MSGEAFLRTPGTPPGQAGALRQRHVPVLPAVPCLSASTGLPVAARGTFGNASRMRCGMNRAVFCVTPGSRCSFIDEARRRDPAALRTTSSVRRPSSSPVVRDVSRCTSSAMGAQPVRRLSPASTPFDCAFAAPLPIANARRSWLERHRQHGGERREADSEVNADDPSQVANVVLRRELALSGPDYPGHRLGRSMPAASSSRAAARVSKAAVTLRPRGRPPSRRASAGRAAS